MKIIYESYGYRYTIESNSNEHDSSELKELFSRLLVVSGFPPSVIDDGEESGKFEFVNNDEVIITKERLEELERGRDGEA